MEDRGNDREDSGNDMEGVAESYAQQRGSLNYARDDKLEQAGLFFWEDDLHAVDGEAVFEVEYLGHRSRNIVSFAFDIIIQTRINLKHINKS